MRRLARFVIRRRWVVIALTAVFVPLAVLYGADVAQKLTVGGYEDPGSESAQAATTLTDEYGAASADFVIVVTAKDGDVDDPAVVRAGRRLTRELGAEPPVSNALSYWAPTLTPPLASEDDTQALVIGSFEGGQDEAITAAEELSPKYTRDGDVISTQVTGAAEVGRQATETAESDLKKSEGLTLPITLFALILVFGTVVAGLLPLAVGIVAVLGTFVILTVLSGFTEVSVFALNLTTGLGLGLAIDYSLFIVSRYREELHAGYGREVALSHTMQTAGRTVAFSAGTVTVSMLALLIFPVPYLRSFAFAGVAVVALAGIAAVIVLPAILAVLGDKVDKGRLFHRKVKDPETGFWHDQAWRVMRHPWLYAITVSVFLCILAVPFFQLTSGQVDDRILPEDVSSRAAAEDIREHFTSRESGALSVLLDDADPDADSDALDAYARQVAALDGVERVDAVTGYYGDGIVELGVEAGFVPANELSAGRFGPDAGSGEGTWMSVVPAVEPLSPEGEALVHELRAIEAPGGTAVTGPSAQLVDSKEAVSSNLPIALGLIALSTFVLLFLMTGSLLVPAKALLLNVLSLTATFGGMVWVFQEGHGADLLGFTPTGTIDTFTPVLMFCIAFGLSMDYEVFLISRIKEEYDLDRDNEAAVAKGLQATGGIVTAAAVLLAIVFLGIATSSVSVVKLFGLGLTMAVLVDAFLIRATLVPAFMRLAGRANWWAPKPLRRFHLRFGIWENEPIAILDQRDLGDLTDVSTTPPEPTP
jgi:RND superfamily putative drug exporter